MCGIVSIFSYNNPEGVDREELLRIRDRMTKRGPDGAGEWYSKDNRVGLGHRRLSIIDLSESAAQPMCNEDGTVWITFNGEIYNYQALRSTLVNRGHRFRSNSDTEVTIHGYEEWGIEPMLKQLRGMFAFAMADFRSNDPTSGIQHPTLIIVRDPFGIKPLYYSDDGRSFRAASQVKALLAGGKVDASPEPAGHVGFFLWGHVPDPYTMHKGVRSLPAGSYMTVDRSGKASLNRYFSIPRILSDAANSVPGPDAEEMRECLRSALLDTVQHHLVADVPVGFFLSAGMDSTTLVALASEINKSRLDTMTLGFREYIDTHDDETPLATLVADRYRTSHQTVWVSKEDFRSELGQMLEDMDQPSTDGVNSYFVSRAAVRSGLKVAVSGLGGDELFGSYPSFKEVPKMVRTFGPASRFPFLGKAFRVISAPLLKRFTSPKYAGLFEYGGSYAGAYLLRRGMFMPWELPDILDGDMVREGWRELQTQHRLSDTVKGIDCDYLKVSALEMCWYMCNQLLRDTDWASMAHSLEVRVPFVDTNLLYSLSPFMAASGRPTKADMASTPKDPLPYEVRKRVKTGFSVPVRQWLMGDTVNTSERGLRGWAKWLYRHANDDTLKKHSENKRVLISSISAGSGGVASMTAFIIRCLRNRGMEPVLAYYEPYSVSPNLSVPFFRLLQRRVGSVSVTAYYGCEAHGIGAWLPELEFTHYLPNRQWTDLMRSCSSFVVVSGNCLAGMPFAMKKRPFVAWVATPWHADRKDRVKLFPWYRKLLDGYFNSHIVKIAEKSILRKGIILPLSRYTSGELNSIAGCTVTEAILPMPVDTDFFSPDSRRVIQGRVGFAGRFDDPRKNVELLIEAVGRCRQKGVAAEAYLIGHGPWKKLTDFISSLGLTEHITVVPHLDRQELCDILKTLDIFIVPSHQEGLCIAALEAMSCGCPVVSTRCGGPEEFVIDNETGFLVDFDSDSMSDAMIRITQARDLRLRMSTTARLMVEQNYSVSASARIFMSAFDKAFHIGTN